MIFILSKSITSSITCDKHVLQVFFLIPAFDRAHHVRRTKEGKQMDSDHGRYLCRRCSLAPSAPLHLLALLSGQQPKDGSQRPPPPPRAALRAAAQGRLPAPPPRHLRGRGRGEQSVGCSFFRAPLPLLALLSGRRPKAGSQRPHPAT
jgi:hypothetical protein